MTRRMPDRDGALWPITGIRCPVCRMPALIPDEPHMFCEPPRPPLNPAEHAEVLRVLADVLGAVPHRPLDVWRVSGEPVGAPLPSASIFAAIAAATSDGELTTVWQQHYRTWTPDHTAAAKRRLTEIGA